MRVSMVSAALVAALVGYGSTIALVLSAATALGATPAQTTSWLLAVCLAKALGSAVLSSWHRVPVVLAWSTPGAALIAASEGITMAQGVGAFLLAAGLIVLTGALRPLGRVIAAIPDGVAAAMLAGVLLPFCLKGAGAALALPWVILPMVGVFALVRLRSPPFAVLAALVTGVALAIAQGTGLPPVVLQAPTPVLIAPEFTIAALLGLGRAPVSGDYGLAKSAGVRRHARSRVSATRAIGTCHNRRSIGGGRPVRRAYGEHGGDHGSDLSGR